MPRLPELAAIDFGQGAADHERTLSNYFYRNRAFERACDPGTCLILGEKGTGKSAIFFMMDENAQSISHLANPNFFVAVQANLREHFHLLRSKLPGPISFVTLWKFYFASIVALLLLDTASGEEGRFLQNFIQHWELNPQRFPSFLGTTVKLPLRIAELEIRRGTSASPNPLQLQEVFAIANRLLSIDGKTLWITLDELDKVGINGDGGREQTTDALTALMQTHSELFRLSHLRFKFFIRSDIYEALTYVDKDHFSNSILRLKWGAEDLAIMLALRIAASSSSDRRSEPPPKLAEAHDTVNSAFDWPSEIGDFDTF